MIRQFTGILALTVILWAFLNTPDQRAWQVLLSAFLALAGFSVAAWLIAANFGLERLLAVAICLLLMLGILWFTGLADYARLESAAAWLASALTRYRKKPLAPETVHVFLQWLLAAFQWIVLPLVAIPLTIRAGGAKPIRYGRFVLLYVILFLIGAVVPHYLIHWIPFKAKIQGLWPQLASVAIRFFLAYLIFIAAWVGLGRLSREAVRP